MSRDNIRTVENKKIKPRVRLIVIKNGKILLSYVKSEDFYFYIGGKMEWGETIENACIREVKEECNADFKFGKILYVRDYIKPEQDEHSIELYISGDIDKSDEIEGIKDQEFGGDHWQTWINLSKLDTLDVRPKAVAKQILKDYKSGFKQGAVYLGEID